MKKTLLVNLVLFSSLLQAQAANGERSDAKGRSMARVAVSSRQDTVWLGTDTTLAKISRGIYYSQDASKTVTSTHAVYTAALNRIPTSNFQLALMALVPGLQVKPSSGEPGNEGVALTLRGRSPIILIDGIVRNLSAFDFEAIESITVLKDASALAMLGTRGGNGAILITTKRGGVQKQQISFTAQTSLQRPLQNIFSRPLSSYQYATLYNEAQANDERFLLGKTEPAYSQEAIEGYRSGSDPSRFPNVNWQEQVLKESARFDRFSLTAQGGNKMARYFVSADHFNQQGLFKTDPQNSYNTNKGFEGFSIRSNVDINITSRLEAGISLFGRILTSTSPGNGATSAIYSSFLTTPNNAYPVFNANGSLGGTQQYTNNIVGQTMRAGYNLNQDRDIITDFYLKRDLGDVLPGLWAKARARFTSNVSENNTRNKTFAVYQGNYVDGSLQSYSPYGVDGVQANSNYVDQQFRMDYQEVSVGYDKNIADRHHLSAVLLANRDNAVMGSSLPLTYMGISGNLHYHLDGKYLAQLSFGLNGSNRFPKKGDTKYALFPSLGLGWILSKEEFLKEASWISHLKLNASYGITGWDNASNFTYITRYGINSWNSFGTSAGSLAGMSESALGNALIDYEKTAKFNVGVQATFLKNRLSYSMDFYMDKVSGAWIQRGRNSGILGQDFPMENIGEYRYSGLEMELAWRDSKASGFSYFVSGNLSLQDSEVRNIYEAYQPYSWMNRTGQRLGQRFGFIAEGLFQSEAEIASSPITEGYLAQPGDIKYKDLNNDNLINQFDIAPIGSRKPSVFGGLSAGFQVRQFDVNVLGQVEINRQVVLSGNSFYEFQNRGLGQAYEHHLNRWTPENTEADYPRLSIGNNINNHVFSTFWLKNGNFFRLRNVEIGYTMPAALTGKFGVSSVRIFAGMANAFTLASKQLNGVDPEINAGQYPLQRINTIGLNIKL